MKKNNVLTSRFYVMLFFLVGVVCSVPSSSFGKEKNTELLLNSMFPAGTAQNMHLERWADKIKTDSNGRLTIRIFPGGVLSPVPEIYAATRKGICDLGYGFVYGKYKKTDLFYALDVFTAESPDIQTTAKIYKDLWDGFEDWRAEYDNVKLLWLGHTGRSILHTVKPVRTLEDFKGMQVRTPDRATARVIKALGASAVEISTSELAIALQKGLLQGVVAPIDQLKTFRLADVLPYSTEISFLEPEPNFTVMNIDKYESLSPELRKVIDDSIPWGQKDCLEMWEGTDIAGREYANSLGHEFIRLTPEEKEKWETIIKGVQDEIAAEIDQKGYPGTELLLFVRERMGKHSK